MRFAAHLRRAQPLESLRRWQLLRSAGWPPATHPCRCHAQRAVQQRGPAVKLQCRGHTRKIATPQVTPQQPQRQRRQAGAQRHPQRAARQPQQQRLGQHQAQAFPARQPQHPQQRELLRSLGHAE